MPRGECVEIPLDSAQKCADLAEWLGGREPHNQIQERIAVEADGLALIDGRHAQRPKRAANRGRAAHRFGRGSMLLPSPTKTSVGIMALR